MPAAPPAQTQKPTRNVNIWTELVGGSLDELSPAAARGLLQIRFSPEAQRRLSELLELNRSGSLDGPQEAELDDLIKLGDLIALVWAQARLALRRAGEQP